MALGGFVCGLLSELQTPAERDAARFIIGADMWCDMLGTPEDTAIRNERQLQKREETIREPATGLNACGSRRDERLGLLVSSPCTLELPHVPGTPSPVVSLCGRCGSELN